MIRVGIQSELDFRCQRARSPGRRRRATMPSAMPSRTTGKAQITSMTRGDHGVGQAAVVAGEEAEEDGEQGGDHRGDDADEQRGAAAVEEADHLVAPEVAVGAEEELAAGAEPLRADRLAVGSTTSLHLAVDLVDFSSVWACWPGVGDVVGPDGASAAEEDRRKTTRAKSANLLRAGDARRSPRAAGRPSPLARHAARRPRRSAPSQGTGRFSVG